MTTTHDFISELERSAQLPIPVLARWWKRVQQRDPAPIDYLYGAAMMAPWPQYLELMDLVHIATTMQN